MTNDKTTQCGIYETSIRKICFDTGYNSETILKLLNFFEEKNKIRFSKETNEIALLNWVKFNESSSPKVLACVEKELKQVKNRVLIEYLYSMDTHPQKEEEKEEEQEEEYQQEEALSFRDELFNKWLAYKKEKKSKYTPTGIKQLYRTWENKSDQELEEAINNSIANNYQGIFEPKKQFNGATNNEPKLGTSQARMEAIKKW